MVIIGEILFVCSCNLFIVFYFVSNFLFLVLLRGEWLF